MSKDTQDRKYASYLHNRFCATSLTSKLCSQEPAEEANERTPQSENPKLTEEARAQIPNGPSSLSAYEKAYETFEHLAMGEATNRGEGPMTSHLAAWEANWEEVVNNQSTG
jgi:hypothetical protein